jgi:hypothetical protein
MGRFDGGAAGWADIIKDAIEDRLREFNTATPGEVMEYDATRQTATVRPMVAGAALNDEGAFVLEYPPDIYDVPVLFHRALGGGITLPFRVGDTVQILYNQRDIGQWRATNQRGSPGDHRINSMAGAIAIAGLYADSNALETHDTQNLVIYVTGGGSFVKLGSADATAFVALASKVDLLIEMFGALLAGDQVNDPTTGAPIPGALWVTAGTLADAGALKTAAGLILPFLISSAATKVKAI